MSISFLLSQRTHVNLIDLVKSFPTLLLRSLVQIFIFQFLSMSLFLNLLFETDSYSNEYLLAKFGFDTAENEPDLIFKIFLLPRDLIFPMYPIRRDPSAIRLSR